MRRHPLLFLQIAADEIVEELISSAEFHVGLDHHRIPALHDRILNLMRVNRMLLVDARAEILALQHLLQGDEAVEPDHLLEFHLREPVAVVDDLCPRRIEDLEGLFAV